MVRSRLHQDKQARLECQSTCSYIHFYNTDTSQWRTVPKDSFTKYLPLLFRHFCTVGTWLFVVHIKAFWLNGDSVGGKYTNLGSINNLATVLTVLVYWILLCVNYCLNVNYEGEGQLDVIKINKKIKILRETHQHLTTLVPFLIELEFAGNVGFQGQAKTGVPGEKPLGAERKTNHKLNQQITSFWGWSYKERKRA